MWLAFLLVAISVKHRERVPITVPDDGKCECSRAIPPSSPPRSDTRSRTTLPPSHSAEPPQKPWGFRGRTRLSLGGNDSVFGSHSRTSRSGDAHEC